MSAAALTLPNDRRKQIEEAILYDSPRGGRDGKGGDIAPENITKYFEFLIFTKNVLDINKNISMSQVASKFRVSSYAYRALLNINILKKDESGVGYKWGREGFEPNKHMAKEIIVESAKIMAEYKIDLKARKKLKQEAEEESSIIDTHIGKSDSDLLAQREAREKLKLQNPDGGRHIRKIGEDEDIDEIVFNIDSKLHVDKAVLELKSELDVSNKMNALLIKRLAKAEIKIQLAKQVFKF